MKESTAKVYTIKECCEMLRYQRTTIYAMISAGVLKQIGRGRVQAASFDRFIGAGMVWQEYAKRQAANTAAETYSRGKQSPSRTLKDRRQKLKLKF